MCSGDFGQFYCAVGSSSPLFFTGFLQAKVIKRVIRMLKTDVNNRNETAVTDERLGQERAQLVEMTPLPRSRSPPPLHSPFLFRPLGPRRRGLRRPAGDTPVKLHSGGGARLRAWEAARGASRASSLGSHRLIHRSAARWAPLGARAFADLPQAAGRVCRVAAATGPAARACPQHPRLRPAGYLRRCGCALQPLGPPMAAFGASVAFFLPNQSEEAAEVPSLRTLVEESQARPGA